MSPTQSRSVTKIVFSVAVTFSPAVFASGSPDPGNLQADYAKSALPIFQQKCFSCHGPKPQSVDGIKDVKLRKRMAKAIKKAQNSFPMEETFPYSQSDDPQEDLDAMEKALLKDEMPPKKLVALKMGTSLTAEEKNALADWIARSREALK
jgi:mono/diheme cytochrome c family protein